ncbi:TPA: gamma-glutamyl-gamma-aminobutyrate hydrolase family protein [Pasteurella multocida]|nr:gamma-glutamyl-gamma-aminobutyrate hydrolase family protein [Pasteurella multocida subsp. multocida]HDR1420491.1 gamma-glutamyl-gamma-aminobutyrate hydrolase family protein [Pasteurella multocida]
MNIKPTIGVICCARRIDDDSDIHHLVFKSYVEYVKNELEAIPLLIPALFNKSDDRLIEEILKKVDGILLTGSPSNICLRRKNESFKEIEIIGYKDINRDYTAMKLIEIACKMDKPLLGICRGLQEINVFFGGELYQEIHKVSGMRDHRSDKSKSMVERYQPAHKIIISPNSILHYHSNQSISSNVLVNSLHGQGISVLGKDLLIEAIAADDGVIEAIRHKNSKFIYGVQWHIEWSTSAIDPIISNLFRSHCIENKGDYYGN